MNDVLLCHSFQNGTNISNAISYVVNRIKQFSIPTRPQYGFLKYGEKRKNHDFQVLKSSSESQARTRVLSG